MAAVEAKRPKPLHAFVEPRMTSTTEAEHEEFRKRRHRETEKQRRRRTKAAVDQLRQLCKTEPHSERVIVLEQAVNTVRRLQEQVAQLELSMKLAGSATEVLLPSGQSASAPATTADRFMAMSACSLPASPVPTPSELGPISDLLSDPLLPLPMLACATQDQDCCGSMAEGIHPNSSFVGTSSPNSWLRLPSPTPSFLFDLDPSATPCLRGLVLQSVLSPPEVGIVQAYVGRLESLEEIIAQHVQNCPCGTCQMATRVAAATCPIVQGALHATPAQLQAELDLYQQQRAVSLDMYALSNPVPLLAISAKGMYVDINQAACAQLETSSLEVLGKFMWELPISPDWRVRASESRGMASGSITTLVTVERLRTVRTRTLIWIRQTLISQSTAVNVHGGGSAGVGVHYALCMLQTVEAPSNGAHVVACM